MEYVKITGNVLEEVYRIFKSVQRIIGKVRGEQYVFHAFTYQHCHKIRAMGIVVI
tara:strand:- start:25127 stop:25291 length:165 start_codon:yes stop_codon:yes gene_type:complete